MTHTNIDTKEKYVKMKKDIYDHLAHTFLDKKDKRKKIENKQLWFYISTICILFFLAIFIFGRFFIKKNVFLKNLIILQDKQPIEIDYDFNSLGISKVKILSFELDKIDLSRYNFIELKVRNKNKSNIDSTIRLQIENSFLEKDQDYISGINIEWRKFSFPLRNFKRINDWSSVKYLSFIIEEWNVFNKKDKIFIDDIRFVE